MLGNYEEGDKEIELVCNMIKQAAEAEIPAIKYFLCALENQRTESKPPGRGGSQYSTWNLEEADSTTPRFDEPVTAEMNWARITYFLERVIPWQPSTKSEWLATHAIRGCHPAIKVLIG